MAGIGIKLERYFQRDSLTSELTGYVGAGAIFTGPWAFGTLAIVTLYLQVRSQLSDRDGAVLFAMITYGCAGAMLLTGPLTFVVTRYLADQIYTGRIEEIGPTYATAWILHSLIALVVGTVFYFTEGLAPGERVLGVGLFLACTQLWLAGSFVSMLRAHGAVAATFALGYASAAGLAVLLGTHSGLVGYLAGFWAGIAGIAMALTGLLLARLPFPQALDLGFLRYVRKRPALVLLGATMAMGTWIDKVLFWVSPGLGVSISGHMGYFPSYDVAAALGALTALPGLAWLLLSVETGFAFNVRTVYSALRQRDTFDRIHEAKLAVARGISRDLWSLARLQGPVTLATLIYGREILIALGLPLASTHMLRYSALSAVGQVVLQAVVLYFLYFDAPEQAAIATTWYFVTNFGLSLLSIRLGYWSFGLASCIASWSAAWIGAQLLDRRLRALERDALRHFAKLSLAS